MSTPRLTVAICTWNRSALLQQTLERMTQLADPPGGPWELLVINNNSTDETEAVVSRFASRLPLRSVLESTPGLSHARNRAVAEARGEYLLFTDDDVLVDPGWLIAYDAAFRADPVASQFGGPVDPWFEGTPPKWLADAFPQVAAAYAAIDHGAAPIALDDDHLVFGANIAARTSDLRRYRFDPRLGRTGNNMLSGEETTLFSAMRRDGLTGRWVPTARVRHFIPRERQTLGYLRRWHVGVGWYAGVAPPDPREQSFMGVPLWVWRQVLEYAPRYCVARVTSSPAKWLRDMGYVASAWGFVRGRVHARRGSS
jgi:glycosyltransferase involved in cell wall biosynthesis